jgi:quinate dehydrogenase
VRANESQDKFWTGKDVHDLPVKAVHEMIASKLNATKI